MSMQQSLKQSRDTQQRVPARMINGPNIGELRSRAKPRRKPIAAQQETSEQHGGEHRERANQIRTA
jgi:hypothetical protein